MSFGKLQPSPTKNAQAFHKKQCRRELQKASLCRFSKVRAVYSKPFPPFHDYGYYSFIVIVHPQLLLFIRNRFRRFRFFGFGRPLLFHAGLNIGYGRFQCLFIHSAAHNNDIRLVDIPVDVFSRIGFTVALYCSEILSRERPRSFISRAIRRRRQISLSTFMNSFRFITSHILSS